MTKGEFTALGHDVFLEIMPKVKKDSREAFLRMFCTELIDYGLDIEESYEDEEEEE